MIIIQFRNNVVIKFFIKIKWQPTFTSTTQVIITKLSFKNLQSSQAKR